MDGVSHVSIDTGRNERCAGYIATQAPGYASGYVQEKAADFRNEFYLYWNRNA